MLGALLGFIFSMAGALLRNGTATLILIFLVSINLYSVAKWRARAVPQLMMSYGMSTGYVIPYLILLALRLSY